MATMYMTGTSGWSYNASGGYKEIGQFTTGSKKIKINNISLYLGTGSGDFHTPDQVYGNGSAISTNIQIQGYATSNNLSINKVVTAHNGYPPRNQMALYTFTFPSDVILDANHTYIVTILTYRSPVICYNDYGFGKDGYTKQGGKIEYLELDDKKYTIQFDTHGGSPVPPSKSGTNGTTIILPECSKSYVITYDANGGTVSPSSKVVKCTFDGWSETADGSGEKYAAKSAYRIQASKFNSQGKLTLHALWRNPAAGPLATPTRNQCEFSAWTTTRNGTSTVTSGNIITQNLIIYAKWRYKITYDGNGGVFNGKSQFEDPPAILHGSDYTVKRYAFYIPASSGDDEPTNLIKNYRQDNKVSGIVREFDSVITNVTQPITLYAQYSIKNFTVTFTDGYSGKILKTQTVNAGQDATPPPNPTRRGYTFKGWLGNYKHVLSDSTVSAYWGFTPVWIRVKGEWIKYEPKEVD